MKKNTYKLENIDCAACALKIEDSVNKIEGVSSSLNYMLLKFYVKFDENLVTDEIIEETIHNSLDGVKIVEKNNKEYIDNYESKKRFKKILFKGKKRI